jgi:hypothetical protein
MNKFLIIISISILLTGCSSDRGHRVKVIPVSLSKIDLPIPGPKGIHKEFKDLDTVINLQLLDLVPGSIKMAKNIKKKEVTKAVQLTMPDAAYRYFELPYSEWKDNKMVERPADYRLKDFHFIDLDNDGDLDILHTSLVDQAMQTDSNTMLLFQNNNGKYKKYQIRGYLYYCDFSKKRQNLILFKTVTRPCCEYLNYNFYQTKFNSKKWTFQTVRILEIDQSRVNEKL